MLSCLKQSALESEFIENKEKSLAVIGFLAENFEIVLSSRLSQIKPDYFNRAWRLLSLKNCLTLTNLMMNGTCWTLFVQQRVVDKSSGFVQINRFFWGQK